MKGRDRFTTLEAEQIRQLLDGVRRAEPGAAQKQLRDQLRALGFYISDWGGGPAGFTRSDFDELVGHGTVTVDGEKPGSAPEKASASGTAPPTLALTRPQPPAAVAAVEHLAALTAGPMTIATAFSGAVPNRGGLYAMYAEASAWQDLGLGVPPDGRPLYVGKAERSLRSRDLSTHFASGRTGQSSPRRSFAALLTASGALDLQPIPRRPNNPEPGKWTHYALEPGDEDQLTVWMHERLGLAIWPASPSTRLGPLEIESMAQWRPPLNLTGVSTPWTAQVKAARAAMAERAQAWAREHGFPA